MAGAEHVISVEELLSRRVNVVRTEAGQTSRGNDADQETQRSSIEVPVTEKSSPRRQRLDRLKKAGHQAEETGPKIQKVSFLLRENENVAKYFEPRVVSLGPIHHAESLYAQIEKKISKLREYFDEEVTKEYYDDEYLAWMLFVDGCAVLQFMYYAVLKEKFKDVKIEDEKFKEMKNEIEKIKYVKIKNDQAVFGQDDLFLLENQLPYQLLKDLMELSDKKDILLESIDSFIQMHAKCVNPEQTTSTEKLAHLLDRLRTRLLGKSPDPGAGDKGNDWHSYRNVQELRAAGIQLKPSKTSSLTDVSFTDRFTFYPGYLHLPRITVDDSTGPKFLNLIAYEGCPDFDNEFSVTTYICFLDSLIDHPDDVKELRKAKILHNLLGSDEEVSQLFNTIATDLVPNPETYAKVKRQIQQCYNNKWKTWIAQAIHDHFSSPWTFVGFLAAFLALALTVTQTWYSVHGSPSDSKDRSPPAPRIPKRY
ncbi:hypothetical protein FH972_016700 [Carpinus fangiana]|uniref:Uncharacterized protein n=1 Tax=Carpinus fangiana TaxID=176857 RepID=A0A5N6RIQ8_9ROSI|nr:hypothetical protein FH972_016700 [Carpinus fangiana]